MAAANPHSSTLALAPSPAQPYLQKFFKRKSSYFANLQKCQWNKFWVYSLVVLNAALIGLLVITLVYSLAATEPFDYGIVFDAGSTHTEMLLYTWKGKKWHETGVVQQVDSCYLSGGIGELFVDDPAGVQNYLTRCLAIGTDQIPPDSRWNSPVFLAATAGLRMLQIEKAPAVQEVLGNVTELVEDSGLKYRPGSVKVITGQQEGVSAWVAVNYLTENLLRSADQRVVGSGGTVGALDLGGASTQITFESGDADNSKDRVTLRLYGQEYNVSAKSYLCHGVGQLILRHSVSLLQGLEPSESVTVQNPCRAVGSTGQANLTTLRTPCTETTFLPTFSNVIFEGTGDAALCASQLRNVLSLQYCQATFVYGNCFDEVLPPRPAGTSFLAFSTFFYIASGFNLTEGVGSGEFLSKVNDICGFTEAQLNATHFPEVGDKYKRDMCYEGIYQFILLKELYNFSEEEWLQTKYVDKINSTSVGWALGFMIENTNVIPMEDTVPGMPVALFIVLAVLFIAMIGASLWLAIIALKHNRSGAKVNQTGPFYGALA